MTRDERAVVIGAGVGGLASALALRQSGWAAEVLERSACPQTGGAGLVLAPNAVHALGSLGVVEALRDTAVVIRSSGIRRPDGRWLSRLDSSEVARRTGAPVLGTVRAALMDALVEAVGPDVIRVARQVDDPTGLDADLVVGADGINSVVRRTWWPDQPPPRYAGYTAWRALVTDFDLPEGVASETWGRGARFGIVPVGPRQAYVYATANTPAGSDLDPGELRRLFAGWHAPIPGLLDALDGGTMLRHDVHDLGAPLRTLHRDAREGSPAVVLVGDAAHAMEPNLGQGACTALEDAVELAHHLRASGDLGMALERFTRARRPRVTGLSRQARRLGRVAQLEGPVRALVRDSLVSLAPRRVALHSAASVAGWLPPHSLPEVHQ